MRMQRSLDQVPDQFSPADRIDLVCDKFEQACRRGEAPQIEEFLDVCDASERELLLTELLLVDREFRIKRGERADRIEYLQRFPEYSTVIGELDFATIADPGYAAKEPLDHRSFLRSGDRVADFELLEELGSGASGTVWKAHDPRLCRTVALKLPRSSRISAAERERFLREGRAAAQLRHPNIVAVHEADEKHGQAFIATEYIAGADLRQWLRKKCPSPAEAAELTSKLAEALQHAHERNVIHRDLKPANILIDRWGQPYIADFGLAKWSSDGSQMTLHGHVLGTPAYMSPEQARGDAARVDRRSDVYGLGALFYRTLTGRPPFEGDSATIIHAAIHDDPPPPRAIKASVPRDLETICLKAMEKEPSRRFASTDEMATDLQRFLRGEPILARRASIAIRSWNWLRRHAAAVALILLALFTASSLGMVRMLARENRELLGLQTVTLTTDPPGAKVAFVPLSESTGELLPSNAIFARGETPVREELQPGDYSVVAVLSDGRFHEVFRHVPDASEQTAAGHNHRFWKRGPNDTVQLSGIKIPGIDVTHSMVLIEGQENFQMGVSASSELPQHTRRVASFYVDPFEFTFGEYRRLLERLPFRYHDNPPADDEAVYASYDEAVSLAESVGKRLPTELEYEFAATARGTSRYPWGDAFPQIVPQPSFGPVGTPQFDRLSVQRPVYGLCSGKAEWTCSWAIPYPPYSPADPIGTRQEIRVFRGGDFATVEGNPRMTPTARDPRRHYAMNRHEVKPGLGFRCVRSFTPLFAYDEIP